MSLWDFCVGSIGFTCYATLLAPMSIYLFIYLMIDWLIWKGCLEKSRDRDLLSTGLTPQIAKMEPGAFLWISNIGAGAQTTWAICHEQGAGSDMRQQWLKLVSIRDSGVIGSRFTHYATTQASPLAHWEILTENGFISGYIIRWNLLM